MTLAYVGLGANLGEPRRQLRTALEDLDGLAHTRLTASSRLYRSAPLGYVDQAEFVNAVAQLDTGLEPEDLLAKLLEIERRHGRKRSFPNAPRPLDLDLLLYGEAKFSTRRLTIPHPRMHERAFVLKPLLDLDPEISIPGKGAASELLAACGTQQIERIE